MSTTFGSSENSYQCILGYLQQNTHEQSTTHTIEHSATTASTQPSSFSNYTLSEYALQEHALKLLAHHDAYANMQGTVTFPPEAWESLSLLHGTHNILSAIDRTQTVLGRIFLAKLLTNPINDPSQILKRQALIKALIAHPELVQAIKHNLQVLSAEQNGLISLTDNAHPLYDKGLSFYHHQWIVRHLSKTRLWENIAKLIGDIWFIAGPILYSSVIGKLLLKRLSHTRTELREKALGTKTPNHATVWQRTKSKVFNEYLIDPTIALIILYSIPHIMNVVRWIKHRSEAHRYMRNNMALLKTFFEKVQLLKELAAYFPELIQLSDEVDTGVVTTNPTLSQLKTLLKSPAFSHTSQVSYFHPYAGDVIAALPLLTKCHQELYKGVALIGALDAYCALATLYQEHTATDDTPFCFARFIKHPTPYLSVQDFWHPSLQKETVVHNSITLGGAQYPQNIILTGIYESGKSTILKSIALNVLCAQTIGICPARDFVCTPFSCINVYANITDDLANNRSLFKTELYRSLQLLKHIQKLPPHQFSFSTINKAFTGTEAGAGEAASYAVTRYLAKLENSISLNTTNFLSLTELAEKNPENIKNYYLPAKFNGSVEYSYALTPGRQELQQTCSIFKEEQFPVNMIQEMEHLLQNPGEYLPPILGGT